MCLFIAGVGEGACKVSRFFPSNFSSFFPVYDLQVVHRDVFYKNVI